MSETKNIVQCHLAFNRINKLFEQLADDTLVEARAKEVFLEYYEENPYSALLTNLQNIESVLQVIANPDKTRLNQTLEQMNNLFYP